MVVAEDQPILNEFDCPLLTLTKTICCISCDKIYSAVSIVHMCDDSCELRTTTVTRHIERESVSLDNQLCLVHYLSNKMFCLNVYCTCMY